MQPTKLMRSHVYPDPDPQSDPHSVLLITNKIRAESDCVKSKFPNLSVKRSKSTVRTPVSTWQLLFHHGLAPQYGRNGNLCPPVSGLYFYTSQSPDSPFAKSLEPGFKTLLNELSLLGNIYIKKRTKPCTVHRVVLATKCFRKPTFAWSIEEGCGGLKQRSQAHRLLAYSKIVSHIELLWIRIRIGSDPHHFRPVCYYKTRNKIFLLFVWNAQVVK